MDTQLTTPAPTEPPIDAQLRKLRELNTGTALVCAEGAFQLATQLAVEAQVTQDLDLKRKVFAELARVAAEPEKREAQKQAGAAATALLQIILDDAVPQVAPPKKARQLQDVEDAVVVAPPVPATADQEPAGWAEDFA